MPNCCSKKYLTVALALLFGLQMLFFAAPSTAQEAGCVYDKTAPSLDNARLNFKSLNYRCSELELLDLLEFSTTTLQEKADAYVLLAAVYYAMMGDDDQERRNKVVEQFTAAFREYRDWKGTLEITSSEFAELMEEAKQRVDSGEAAMETTMEPVSLSTCPSSTAAMVSTGVLVAAGAFYFISSSGASSKWDDYEADPDHPQSLYEDYESAVGTRNIAVIVTGVAAVTTGYLWFKYKSAKKDCEQGMGAGLEIAPSSRGLQLTYRF